MVETPATMDAAVLYSARDLRYERVATPKPRPDEVLVRITTNGLCGSDIHFYEHGQLGPFVVTSPYIPGHEACGIVAQAAASGSGPALGSRVAIEPGVPCRRCEMCKSGRYNLCPDVVFMSAPPVNGTFAGYAAVAADFAHPVPDTVDDEAAAFVEPVSVGIQACNRAGLHAGDTIAVLGSGPIGFVTLLVARAYGATQAFAVDLLPNRLALAGSLGATPISGRRTDPVEAIADLTHGRGVDVVFDTSGSSTACKLTPHLAKRGGVVTLVGWPESSTVDFPIEVVLDKGAGRAGRQPLCQHLSDRDRLLASGRLHVDRLVSHRFAFTEVVEAFEFASAHRSETIKVMVRN